MRRTECNRSLPPASPRHTWSTNPELAFEQAKKAGGGVNGYPETCSSHKLLQQLLSKRVGRYNVW